MQLLSMATARAADVRPTPRLRPDLATAGGPAARGAPGAEDQRGTTSPVSSANKKTAA